MSEFITPEHKIIALILEASGEPTDADKVCCLGNIPDVALAVRQLREMVIQHSASEAIPAENTQTVSERLSLFLTISSHLKTLVKAKLIDLRLNPSMPLLHFREMISRKRIVKWWMIKCQKAFRDTLKKFLMKPGSYRLRLPSRCNQKTWIKPVRLFLTTFHLTPQSVL